MKNNCQKYIYIHKSIKSRKKFKLHYIIFVLTNLLFFVAAALAFAFSGLRFDPDVNKYTIVGETPYQVIILSIGAIAFTIAIILGIWTAIIIPVIFKQSQITYYQTEEFEQIKLKYMESNLKRKNKKDLKWLLKLGYIDKQKVHSTNIIKIKN